MGYEKGWDIDLTFGEIGEAKVREILSGKIEVKTDRLARNTHNIAVEYSYKTKPSGIATTESKWWAFIIDENDTIILIETNRLKRIARKYLKTDRDIAGGDNKQSRMVLIPMAELI